MKRLLTLALLLPAPAMAQQPSPAQVGITTAVPNVVQVYDSSHNWATIGTVDPATHLFSPTLPPLVQSFNTRTGAVTLNSTDVTTALGFTPISTLPIASTTVLGGVKVDGTTITATGAGVISGTPAGITANSTATSGFVADHLLKSDGTKVQSVGDNCTNWSANPSYPVYICGLANYPATLYIDAVGYVGVPTGIGFNVYPGSLTAGVTINDGSDTVNGYYSFVHSTNNVDGIGDAVIRSPAADIISEGVTTRPQAFRVHNTWTDDSNGEWGALDWKTVPNTLTIGTENNGTGTQRPVNIVGNPVTINGAAVAGSYTLPTASTTVLGGVKVDGSTINISGGVISGAPAGITAGTTPTSGFVTGKILYSDGTKVQPVGDTVTNWTSNPSFPLYMAGVSFANPTLWLSSNASAGASNYGMGLTTYSYGDAGVSLDNQNGNSFFGFLTATNTVGSSNTGIMSQGYGIINIRSQTSPTAPQQLRVANTFTDASNGEWGAMDWSTVANTLTLGAQKNGTGTLRPVNIVGSAVTINGATPLTGISLPQTVAGTVTSGGIPYFNSTTAMSSSALLAANAIMVGGGAGVAPSTVTTAAGVVAAFAIAPGTTGSHALQSGAITTGNLVKWNGATGVADAGVAPSTSGMISNGTQPTITGSGGTCATTTKVGGATAGTVVLSAVCATTNTIAWTGLPTAPNGWVCDAQDRTTRTAGPFLESASTTTGFTLTVGATSSVAADVLQWKCMGY